MARNTSKGPTPVDAIKHDEKRTNIPTADAHDFVDDHVDQVRKVRYQRDESLDPQLVWRGKYPATPEDLESDLIADAPPIYIQEKIDPRVLVENLRRTAKREEDEPELMLFESFDGLDEMESIEYYQHDANWSNRMILGDSLQVMASLAEREKLRGKVQMIYIDPPYGIKFGSNWQVSARNRDVRDGKLEDSAREAEQIKAFRDTWELGINSYLTYLRDRLHAARELLTKSGSCFVQISDENLHLVRLVMDEVFGSTNFVGQIVFQKTGGQSTGTLARTVDYLVWYALDAENVKYRQIYLPRQKGTTTLDRYDWIEEPSGAARRLTAAEVRGEVAAPAGRRFRTQSMISSGASAVDQTIEFGGRAYRPRSGSHWKTTEAGMRRLWDAGRLVQEGNGLTYKRYADDFPVVPLTDRWESMQIGTSLLYVVQTATSVIERCVLMCTDPGDLVLDPTCGSGTSAFVAEQWGRRWVTVDTSRVALALTRQRIMGARFPWYLLADSAEGAQKERSLNEAIPRTTSFSGDIRQGFVYERVPHIMLKSIANNPDIRPGMSPGQISAAIGRHADSEVLYDCPYEDKKKVRVAGPFTVESLSPHRALSFGDVAESNSETKAAKDADGPNFEQTILENLAKAGIQNGKRAEKLQFEAFENYAGSYVQAVGQQIPNGEHAAPTRIAIAVGPQYGTVSPSFVKSAAREAIKADDVDLLAILGFAFDPQVTSMKDDDEVAIEPSGEGFANVEGIRRLAGVSGL